MRNKFFFGVVVGFFVAVVAFVVFMFFSGTARAAVLTEQPTVAVREVNSVGVGNDVEDMVPVAAVRSVSPMVNVREVYAADVDNHVAVSTVAVGRVPREVLVSDTVSIVGGVGAEAGV